MLEVPTLVATGTSQTGGTVSPPTFNRATEEQHAEFRHLLSLLRLATAYNYRQSMLPDPEYAKNFNLEADDQYRRFTRQGVLNALATIFVRNDEVIATTQLSLSPAVLTTVERRIEDICGVAVMENSSAYNYSEVDFVEMSNGVPFALEGYTGTEDTWFENLFNETNSPEFTIQDHIATVCSFINDYKVDKNNRPSLEEAFLIYLTVSCKKKMLRRARHWSFLGVLYHLCQVPEHDVLVAFDKYWVDCDNAEPGFRTDRVLLQQLRGYFSANFNADIIAHHPRKLQNFHSLQAKFFLTGHLATMNEEKFSIYDQSTCIGFHNLLIATLIGYARSLQNMGPDNIGIVYAFAALLWQIKESRAFRLHIAILSRAEHLPLPTYADLHKYLSFGLAHAFSWINWKAKENLEALGMGKGKGKGKGKGGGMGMGKRNRDGMEQGASMDVEGDDAETEDAETEDAEAEDAEDVESAAIASQATVTDSHGQLIKGRNLGTAIRRYIGVQVSHFGAASLLRTYARHLSKVDPTGPEFRAPLIAVNHIGGEVSWSGITQMVKGLVAEQNPDATVKDIQEQQAELERVIRVVAKAGTSSVHKLFRKLIDGGPPQTVNVSGAVHCEVALAAMLKFGKMLPKGTLTDSLHALLAMSDIDLIAVSKLCCAICWEVLKILKGEHTEFQMRGRHSALYALHLPQLLPAEVLDTLIQQFRATVHNELQYMIKNWHENQTHGTQTHKRTPSDHSDSAVSIGDQGTDSGLSAPTVIRQHHPRTALKISNSQLMDE